MLVSVTLLLCLSACKAGETDLAPGSEIASWTSEADVDFQSTAELLDEVEPQSAADFPNIEDLQSTAEEEPGISARMLEERVSPETAALTVVLENHSDIPMMYGEDFSLETYRDGAWTIVEFQEHYGFAAMGWMLYEYDQNQISYSVSGLQEPLTQGLYRITTSEFQEQGTAKRECHPGLSLEFLVQEDGAVLEMPQEPEYYSPEPLPEIEDWQWYTWDDCVESYEYEGYSVGQSVSGSEGFLGILYQEATSTDPGREEPMYLDLFDRKTGLRYSVYTKPVVEFGHVTALEGGSFMVETNQETLKFWVEDGELRQEQAG
jgi:hypothetical protein